VAIADGDFAVGAEVDERGEIIATRDARGDNSGENVGTDEAASAPSSSVRIRLEPLSAEIEIPRGGSLVPSLAAHGVEFPCGGIGECSGCRQYRAATSMWWPSASIITKTGPT
jgi:hypothetical protein